MKFKLSDIVVPDVKVAVSELQNWHRPFMSPGIYLSQLGALISSMDKVGLLEPIKIFKDDDGKYYNEDGNHRIICANILEWEYIDIQPDVAQLGRAHV